jgi:hypothetical protein
VEVKRYCPGLIEDEDGEYVVAADAGAALAALRAKLDAMTAANATLLEAASRHQDEVGELRRQLMEAREEIERLRSEARP